MATNAFFAAMVVVDAVTNVFVTKGRIENSIGQQAYYQQGYAVTQMIHEVQWDQSRLRVEWSTNLLGPKTRTRWATAAGQEISLESFVDVPGLPPFSDGTIYPHYSGRQGSWAPYTNIGTSKSPGPPLPPTMK